MQNFLKILFPILLILFGVSFAQAADRSNFDKAAFEKAQNANKPILVYVSAPWCPTCRAQKPILQKLVSSPKFNDLQIFDVDFDSRKDVLSALKVNMQSTLVVFKGKEERGRSAGDTTETGLSTLLDQSL
jgi:thioredoxin 1